MDAPAIVVAAGAAMEAAAIIPVFRSPDLLISGSLYKRIWAAGLLTLFLAVMADLLPQVTGPLALSLILVVIVKSGLFGGSSKSTTPAVGTKPKTGPPHSP